MNPSYTPTLTAPHQYLPINLVPTNLIKCVQCSMYIPSHEFNSHSDTHVNIRYTPSLNQATSRPKVNISQILIEDKQMERNNSMENSNLYPDIQSILPESISKPEFERKIVSTEPCGIDLHLRLSDNKINEANFRQNNMYHDKLDLESQLTNEYETPEQEVESLLIKKEFEFIPKSVMANKKTINVYSNENFHKGGHNDQILLPNKRNLSNEQSNQIYNEPNFQKENIEGYKIETLKKVEKQKQKPFMEVNIKPVKKEAMEKSMISTFSGSGSGTGFFKLTNKINEVNSEAPPAGSASRRDFECKGCHGFYCSECGSTIPPIYRPPYAVEHEQTISKFYENHVYRSKTKCEGCNE